MGHTGDPTFRYPLPLFMPNRVYFHCYLHLMGSTEGTDWAESEKTPGWFCADCPKLSADPVFESSIAERPGSTSRLLLLQHLIKKVSGFSSAV